MKWRRWRDSAKHNILYFMSVKKHNILYNFIFGNILVTFYFIFPIISFLSVS